MSRRPAMTSNHDNQYGAGYDRIIAERPPEIIWRLNNRGIWIAVSIQDWTPERPPPRAHRPWRETRCRKGHEFTPENTYVSPAGYRQCCTCKAERQRKQRADRRAATLLKVVATVNETLSLRDAVRREI